MAAGFADVIADLRGERRDDAEVMALCDRLDEERRR
eukprot:COSAG01_NODE_792_length_13554_cov_13.811891_5_plen_36_part_00